MLRVALEPGYVTVPDDETALPRLLGSYSPATGLHFFPRRRCCPITFTPVEDCELSPRGVLYSWSYLVSSSGVDTLYVGVGQIDLPEGPRVQAPLVGVVGDWEIGMEMEVVLVPVRGPDHAPLQDINGNELVTFGFRGVDVR
jgi:uncharacterized OB-fold protein